MTWTTPADLRAQVQKLWDRGIILSGLAIGESRFPRRLTLKKPSSMELNERFDEVRTWIADLRRQRHVRIELREIRHRVLGSNSVPEEAWVDTLDDALALIGKTHDAFRFRQLLDMTAERQPAWLASYPLRALELADIWPLLLDVTSWLRHHPLPGIYLRQIDLPGVHSKFIEAHRAVLTDLLDLALPSNAVRSDAGGIGRFCSRYGFKEKPVRIRFRMLDPRLNLLPGGGDQDVTLDHDSFARLELKPARVFITENEINFLAFPPMIGSLVIFGAGYGFDRIAEAPWLRRCAIHYWGDIDTHGFSILDQLRSYFPHAASFLMDRGTLMEHRSLWGHEPHASRCEPAHLTEEERMLYDDLRDSRFGPGVRLEQEKIGFEWLRRAAAALT